MSLEEARSLLFVPGSRPDRFAKADAADADVVVLDLEDAVGEDEKQQARVAVADWLATGSAVVRCNAAGTRHHEADLAALAGLPGLAGVMLPKTDNATDIAEVAYRTGVAVLPLVETATGVRRVDEVATAPGVARLVIGTLDLAADLGCEESWEALLLARSTLVLASRAAGIASPVDGVHADLADTDGLREGTRRSRGLGYGGRLCLHPRQVEPINAAFAPTDDEFEWARRVLALDGAVGTVDGAMVDEPVRKRARAILARTQESP